MKGYLLLAVKDSQAVSGMGVFCILISPDIREDLVTRRGLVSKLRISCTNTARNKEGVISDPYASDTKSLDARSVLEMQEIGRGQASQEYFCSVMDMLPPVGVAAYSAHVEWEVQQHHLGQGTLERALFTCHHWDCCQPTTIIFNSGAVA